MDNFYASSDSNIILSSEVFKRYSVRHGLYDWYEIKRTTSIVAEYVQ